MRVPKSFNQVTVEQYQELAPIHKKVKSEADPVKYFTCWANIISILTDKPIDEIQALPAEQIAKIAGELTWLDMEVKGWPSPFIFHKGRLYRARLNAKKLSPGQYIDIKSFLMHGSVSEQLHNLLAAIYVPLSLKGFVYKGENHERTANAMKSVRVGKIAPTVFFYSKALKASIETIRQYGIRLAQEKMKESDEALMETLKLILEDVGAGTSRSTK